MSDFDKEAEREKLRKKYARDAEKRADTQRMSDLLLQGATMTNQHCDRCGDPLFRHNGRTFCATCRAEDEAAGGDAAGDGRDSPVEHAEGDTVADASAAADVRTDADRAADTVNVEPASPAAEQSASHPDDRSVSSSPSDPSSPSSEPTAPARTVDGDVTDRTAARQSLEATLARFAEQAAATDDPRRAREFLAAAREAAETLAALE